MASHFDRDKSIDALLSGARGELASQEAGPACPDPETLAAWFDGGLDAEQVLAIQTHVADCTHCQALSAAFFASDETAPARSAEVVPFRRHAGMDWLPLAIGTIAATLVIWIGVGNRQAVLPEETVAGSQGRAEASAESRTKDAPKQEGTSALAAQGNTAAAAAEAKRLERNAAPVDVRADRSTPPASSDQFRKAAEAAPAPPARSAPPPPPAPALVLPTPVAAPPPPVTAAGAAAVIAPPAIAPTTALQRQMAGPQIVAEFSSALPQSSTVSGLPQTSTVVGGVAGGGAGRGGGGRGGRGGAVALDAVTTGPPFYWRILSTDVIERSLDRLKWEAVAIDPPVQGLAGGAAPSATVCWIVGRAGLVLRTIDGKEFTRVTSPVPADLIAVAAQDALRATVTTAAGQAFTTTDGGKSWK